MTWSLRLRALAVRVAGEDRVSVGLGLVQERLRQLPQHGRLEIAALAQPDQGVRRRLVVAAPGRVEPAARVARDLDQAPLHGGMDVLVAGGERELAGLELGLDAGQAGVDGGHVLGRQDAGGPEHARVRPRAGQVLAPQAPVQRQAVVQALEGLGRLLAEPPAPKPPAAHAAACGGPRRAPAGALRRSSAMAAASAPQTRSTWASVISGKNGSAMVDALIASVTGSVPAS